jgi:hypothetical protein
MIAIMKREILFRGLSVNEGGWEYGDLITFYGNNYICNSVGNNPDFWIKIIHESVGQYTGVKDVNDVSIFEGDIVEDTLGNTGDVIWNKDDCSFNIYWKKDIYDKLYLDNGQFLKVIGNIYED